MRDPIATTIAQTLKADRLARIYLLPALETADWSEGSLTAHLNEKIESGARILLTARDYKLQHQMYLHIVKGGDALRCRATAMQIGDAVYHLADAPAFHGRTVRTCSHIVLMPINGGEFGPGAPFWRSRLHLCSDRLGVLNAERLRQITTHALTGTSLMILQQPLFTIMTDYLTRAPRLEFAQMQDAVRDEADRARGAKGQYAVRLAGRGLAWLGRAVAKNLLKP